MRRALLLFALLGCGDDSAATDSGPDSSTDGGVDSGIEYQMHDEIRVEADDGSATLVIAPSSLPVGVDESEIQLVSGAVAELGEESDVTLLAGYEMLPDGLVFREPARLELAMDSAVSPFGLLVTDSSLESTEVTSELDPESARFGSIAMLVPHFTSALFVVTGEVVQVTVEGGLRPTTLHAPTEALVDFEAPGFNIGVSLPVRRDGSVFEGFAFPSGTWFVEGERLARTRLDEVGDDHEREPLEIVPGPPPEEISSGIASWEATYTCSEVGEMSAVIRGLFDTTWEFTIGEEPEGVIRTIPATASATATGQCDAIDGDGTGDCADSEGPTVECSFFDALIDIEGTALGEHMFTREDIDALFENTAYPCDEFGGGLRTVCRATPGALAEGAMWVGTMVLGTDVPDNDPDHSLIYSLVFDSDNVPDNDWVPIDPFIWDYFQGTDRWYQLIWNHLTRTWSVTVTQVDETQTTTDVPSAVRVVIVQNAVTFFIPVTELPSATPAYRFSAFAHDGSFSRSDRGGDVSGVDPTVPPRMLAP